MLVYDNNVQQVTGGAEFFGEAGAQQFQQRLKGMKFLTARETNSPSSLNDWLPSAGRRHWAATVGVYTASVPSPTPSRSRSIPIRTPDPLGTPINVMISPCATFAPISAMKTGRRQAESDTNCQPRKIEQPSHLTVDRPFGDDLDIACGGLTEKERDIGPSGLGPDVRGRQRARITDGGRHAGIETQEKGAQIQLAHRARTANRWNCRCDSSWKRPGCEPSFSSPNPLTEIDANSLLKPTFW